LSDIVDRQRERARQDLEYLGKLCQDAAGVTKGKMAYYTAKSRGWSVKATYEKLQLLVDGDEIEITAGRIWPRTLSETVKQTANNEDTVDHAGNLSS